jgi:hypothetical protein
MLVSGQLWVLIERCVFREFVVSIAYSKTSTQLYSRWGTEYSIQVGLRSLGHVIVKSDCIQRAMSREIAIVRRLRDGLGLCRAVLVGMMIRL